MQEDSCDVAAGSIFLAGQLRLSKLSLSYEASRETSKEASSVTAVAELTIWSTYALIYRMLPCAA